MAETRNIPGVGIVRKNDDGSFEVIVPVPAPQPEISATPLPVNPVRAAREAQDRDREDRRDRRADETAERATEASNRAAGASDRQAKAAEQTASNQERDATLRLRGDFDGLPAVKEYRIAIAQAATGLRTANDATGDNALIYAYAKVMDPGSVVRESEMDMAASGSSVIEKAVANYKKQFGIEGGGQLSPDVRSRLRLEMGNKVTQLNTLYKAQRQRFTDDAEAFGIDPARIVGAHDGDAFMPVIKEYQAQQKALTEVPDPTINADMKEQVDGDGADEPPPGEVLLGYRGEGENRYPVYGKPGAKPDGDFRQSYIGQGLSGLNEGLANVLGAPVDLTRTAANLIPTAINAVANTNLPKFTGASFMGSEWLKDRMTDTGSIFDRSDDPSKQFVRRMGESVGTSAVPLSRASTLAQYLSQLAVGAGGGVGAATAQQVAPGNPYAEILGEVLGGGATGFGVLKGAQRNAQRGIEEAIPSVEDLKGQAGEMYRAAEARGVTADPAQTQALADVLRQTLRDEGRVSPTGRISEVYPKAREGMQLVDDYAGQIMTPTQLQTTRKVIADGMTSQDGSERRLGSILTDAFDDWAAPIAPELPAARDVASRYLNAEKLEAARELAGARAGQFTGSGYENALRTEYRLLDRNSIKGRDRFAPELNEAIENVSRGTPGSNAARAVGRFAARGPVSAGLGVGAPALLGGAVGGPAGAMTAGLGAVVIGEAGRAAATKMGIRNAGIAEMTARNGGKIEQAPLVPEAFKGYASILAAIQAAKYLEERPSPERR